MLPRADVDHRPGRQLARIGFDALNPDGKRRTDKLANYAPSGLTMVQSRIMLIPVRPPSLLLLALLPALSSVALSQPVTTHPRLFVTSSDVTRLRSWATSTNPIYRDGLAAIASSAKADMDAGLVATLGNGGSTYVSYPAEMYAELFAFMSIISSDQTTRDNYAERARTLLMYVMNQAVLGSASGQPYRAPSFSISDRSRWQGEGFALTVDWIYSYLSAADKATIRQVFLRWIDENLTAAVTDFNHPVPVGVLNSALLVQNRQAVRFSGNNYFTAHMRNIGLMAASFDSADDPGNTLRAFVANAAGAWLYVFDNLTRNEGSGGLLPEGFEYSPQTAGYAIQLLLALKTAGLDDPKLYGPQVVLANNPFFDQLLPAYLHSLSPAAVTNTDIGQVYQPAWFGDGQDYYAPDYIAAFGSLALYDVFQGNTARPQQIRWIETNLAPGGAARLTRRGRDTNFFINAILYFLLFDPAAPALADPRPALATSYFASGMGRMLARTGWEENAAWFTFKLSFNQVDHQTGDGNQFEFYRRGEWLTKERTGYDLDHGGSVNHNTLTLQNNKPPRDPTDYRTMNWQQGSQWAHVAAGDPAVLAHSTSQSYVYLTGDATNLYNSNNEGATDILYASRSIIWLKPDHIVVYDRAASKTADRFKRWWLNIPARPALAANVATMTTPAGQKFVVTPLLPVGATVVVEQSDQLAGDVAHFEPMKFRLRVDATGSPLTTRFLHVLQGADAGASADAATLIQSEPGGTAFDGVAVKDTAILFPVDLNTTFTGVAYNAPSAAAVHRITGLTPNAGYRVTIQAGAATTHVAVVPGGSTLSDDGGVLEFSTGAVFPPVIAGVVNGAGYQAGITPGSWVYISGSRLAKTNPGRTWRGDEIVGGNLPTSLDGVSVTINGKPAYVEYVSLDVINVLAPPDAAVGPVNVIVTNNGTASAPFPATLQPFSPAFFQYAGTSYAIATRYPDNALIGDPSVVPGTVAAKPGDVLILWGTGFGPTDPDTAAGKVVTIAAATRTPPAVSVGGVPATLVNAVLSPGSAGLFQIAIQLPASLAGGPAAVQATSGGITSPARVNIFVQPN